MVSEKTNKKDYKKISKTQIEHLNKRQERILALLKEERNLAQQKFPLPHALLATFGLVCVFAGFYKIIDEIDLLRNNPIGLIVVGVIILVITGAAYKKL
jgi:uncharacterized protein YjeT (DUF2065 family)